jgi:hypothetical protein
MRLFMNPHSLRMCVWSIWFNIILLKALVPLPPAPRFSAMPGGMCLQMVYACLYELAYYLRTYLHTFEIHIILIRHKLSIILPNSLRSVKTVTSGASIFSDARRYSSPSAFSDPVSRFQTQQTYLDAYPIYNTYEYLTHTYTRGIQSFAYYTLISPLLVSVPAN